jgi:hypothetical protein
MIQEKQWMDGYNENSIVNYQKKLFEKMLYEMI